MWKSVRIKDCESWSGASVRKQSGAELAYRVQLDLELICLSWHVVPCLACSLEMVALALDFRASIEI